MITIKLCGGLGNQLFQYAYGYQMAKKVNTGIILDTSWFERQNLRNPEILKFNIQYESIEQVWESNSRIAFFNKTYINRTLRAIGLEKYHIGGYRYFKESRYKYKKSIDEYARDGSYLDGYWQCPKYFDSVRTDLIKMYKTGSLSSEVLELGQKLKEENSIAIHVRRGDYPKEKKLISRLLAISDEYYKQAVSFMLEHVGESAKVYVFSNNMTDALGMLTPMVSDKIKQMGVKTTALEEWYLMKCCKNQIIGNSTFSWWAAYLNENQDKLVCAPGKYMGNDDIIPDNWKVITLVI
ncbi:alpha-1,2-fucosyltransferase [Blautia schinkii]|nr:alpha-1,2-fucosyltransferase [Blautia schinkii]